jgi:hypothetical protein
MEINITHEITSAAARAEQIQRVSRPPQRGVDEATFAASERIDQALASVPDSRPAEVERAKGLVNLVQYPPAETMRKIARLLAMGE